MGGRVRAARDAVARGRGDARCAAKSLAFRVSRWLVVMDEYGGAQRVGEKEEHVAVATTLPTLSASVERPTAPPPELAGSSGIRTRREGRTDATKANATHHKMLHCHRLHPNRQAYKSAEFCKSEQSLQQ